MPTVVELKRIAKSRGLKRYSKLKKSELIKLLFTVPPKPGKNVFQNARPVPKPRSRPTPKPRTKKKDKDFLRSLGYSL